MGVSIKEIKEELIPAAGKALTDTEDVLVEDERRSEVRRAEFSFKDEQYTALTQNTKKGSKFAKCALLGHEVVWIINQDGVWYLSVDGKFMDKRGVDNEGNVDGSFEIN